MHRPLSHVHTVLKPRTDEQFFLDKFLVMFIFSCARQTIFLINFSVTSFITSLYVADTSKYFMYIYYIGLKTNQTLILCTASSIQSIFLSSWQVQLLNQAPCQGKLVNFLPYTRANKTCQGKLSRKNCSSVRGFILLEFSSKCLCMCVLK
jgi:hypothetical protein